MAGTRTDVDILTSLLAEFAVSGPAAIERLRERDPTAYVRLFIYVTKLRKSCLLSK
jgi:hypothetical protein